jgi:hypothetical protein
MPATEPVTARDLSSIVPGQLYTAQEASEFLRVSKEKLKRCANRAGLVPHRLLGVGHPHYLGSQILTLAGDEIVKQLGLLPKTETMSQRRARLEASDREVEKVKSEFKARVKRERQAAR